MKKDLARRAETERAFLEASGAMVSDAPLTATDKAVCENLVVKGFTHFTELGWTSEREGAFLARPNVRRELDRLQSVMTDGVGLVERQKFMARVRMGAMIPMALKIVAMTLRGTMKDDEGKAYGIEELPTREQYLASMDILDRCGVDAREMNLNVLVAAPVERPAVDQGDQERYDPMAVMQRDRVRVAVDRVIKMFADTEERTRELSRERTDTKKRKKLRKRLRDQTSLDREDTT